MNTKKKGEMGYVTEKTIWPTAVQLDASVKSLIDLFYSLADDKSGTSGPRIADEVFTKDGTVMSAAGASKGTEGALRARNPTKNHISSQQKALYRDAVRRSDLTLSVLERSDLAQQR